jgi:ABC-type phosphate/phosphonate transport system permease subunit
VKNWWRKWSYEIPLAFGDALWEVLVVQFAAFLDRLTIRKVIEFVAIAMLAMAFAQTFPIDLAILFAGDTLMYLEFLVAIRLAAGRIHFYQILRLALRLARSAPLVLNAAIRIPVSRLSRLRERRRAGPAKPRRISDGSDDDRGFGIAWGGLATA